MASDGKLTDLIPIDAKHAVPKDLESQIEAYFTPKTEASGSRPEQKIVKLDALVP